MEIVIRPNAEEVATTAADILEGYVRDGATLGLATGSTPTPTYRELIRRHREEGLSFAECRAFLLDEYIGLPREHEQSYYATIRREFTSHIDIDDSAVRSPDGTHPDPEAACRDYEELLVSEGGVDIQILGVGANGHIAFNEPGNSFDSLTHVQDLHPRTVADNARFFEREEDVPRRALTQGLGTIMRARHLLVLATGEAKAEAVEAIVRGEVSEQWPGSIIQRHDKVDVIVDRAAAARL
ncbi:glucosamine-6-phosphate deaminase [Corynebacterium liangguodongii]|uniref:Glucosamine-6-phosphate deaminase n=1 Tax=Corynebacterium liangguodongii TaxID=2079535 RepID=A0A2S0WEH9_9CORY|nr:glucosamine-6-phosphate deaminase [Corynebacterium liangguodongii]AWB84171.1 glucosamine-6-phosphate deaminase [Corynebacterium liangguodongii]PWC00182.1 glucosamine-6-phosphate deaminase [Corynebacterium liangguodongii]